MTLQDTFLALNIAFVCTLTFIAVTFVYLYHKEKDKRKSLQLVYDLLNEENVDLFIENLDLERQLSELKEKLPVRDGRGKFTKKDV